MEKVNTTERLAELRKLMKEHELDVYMVPSEDNHQSEYIAPCDGRREFISGFSGSAGYAVITHEKAALSTDGRYFNQAEKQLDSNWELLKQGLQDVPTISEWTVDQVQKGTVVGVDPGVVTAADARRLSDKIKKKGGETRAVKHNLVDLVWGAQRPARPSEKVIVQPVDFSGKHFDEKLEELRKELEKRKSLGFVVSMLDEVAWLYNLRGSDIPYNPVFFSYAVVTPTTATLYVDETKLDDEVKAHLGDKVSIKSYDAIFEEVAALSASTALTNGKTDTETKQKFLTSTRASWALNQALGGEERVEEARSPVGDAKAIKNETELEGMRQCHIRDGAALIEYFAWLEDQLIVKEAKLDEVDGADKLESIRSKHDRFKGLSFDTISSTGPNAAVIHYKPEKGACSVIDPKAIYLCDSGAQYKDGTTDTTRTLHFSEPTEMERKAYTLVLKGNIALERVRFPKGTTGFALDTIARQFLWAEGLDYRHGTGHGVGSFLNVHEGPIGIGTRVQYSEVSLSIGNVISDEPGYYEDGKFGIRIENMIMVREVKTNHQFGEKPYLGFERVTMVPHCRNLIDFSLLTKDETKFLNEYHTEVYEKTSKFFEEDSLAMKWLKRETAPY
ncbi:putative Xaa-Pro aminopeptidase P [Amniculicola lignicola CBS 123094]|uniref:Probable Xaa-Pro aminopeptidase P n=1 Tax=Amniculicola lignicola CBS 123094 TaxID=1392246 RepID=A0A6A5WBT7_9PLEO|nr:putative Xaa-Pro aminopeptidase P [Amniculicola lignicola CBS 123094]